MNVRSCGCERYIHNKENQNESPVPYFSLVCEIWQLINKYRFPIRNTNLRNYRKIASEITKKTVTEQQYMLVIYK